MSYENINDSSFKNFHKSEHILKAANPLRDHDREKGNYSPE